MMETIEVIGKVRLNKRWYRGSDSYSDGDSAENELLSIVSQHTPEDYNGIIMRQGSWPLLYHLSPVRENIIGWYPFREGARVLELGAGCGAVTGALLDRGLQVSAVDLSLRRCRINAERHANCDDLEIFVGAIEDVLQNIEAQFDYVLLIGVLEYAAMFSSHEAPQEYMLRCIERVLKPEGELIVAIENQLGIKYLAGCREDHTGRFFEGVEGYPHRDGPVTFSRSQLAALFTSCGFTPEFFYPYPDYKFPIKIFSDRKLPAKGELNRNWQNFDASRVRLFDECKASDVLLDAGLASEFANSFLVRLTRQPDEQATRALYVKSSVERRREYRHHTIIMEGPEGRSVYKKAASREAEAHLRSMDGCREALTQALLPGARVDIAPCMVRPDGTIVFPFYPHETLRDLLSRCGGDVQAFSDVVEGFRQALVDAFGTARFEGGEAFEAMFGGAKLPEGLEALRVTNLDMNFDNVFIDGDRYIIVDYEWVLPVPVPLSFVLYRALLVNMDMARFPDDEREFVWSRLGIDEVLRKVYWEMELCFQRYVSGENNKLEQFENQELGEAPVTASLEELLFALQESRRLSKDMEAFRDAYEKQAQASAELTRQRDEYRDALDAQTQASAELTRQRDKYRDALDAQTEASTELTRQRDEYRDALDAQTEASAELTRQRDEYRNALDAQTEASAELTRQRDEYHAANDELWKRVASAESALESTRAELAELIRKTTPFWRRH